jgi:hypothetical protein
VALPITITGGARDNCDRRIRADVVWLARRCRGQVTACFWRKPLEAAGPGADAAPHLREAEHRTLARDDQVARKRDLEAAGKRGRSCTWRSASRPQPAAQSQPADRRLCERGRHALDTSQAGMRTAYGRASARIASEVLGRGGIARQEPLQRELGDRNVDRRGEERARDPKGVS